MYASHFRLQDWSCLVPRWCRPQQGIKSKRHIEFFHWNSAKLKHVVYECLQIWIREASLAQSILRFISPWKYPLGLSCLIYTQGSIMKPVEFHCVGLCFDWRDGWESRHDYMALSRSKRNPIGFWTVGRSQKWEVSFMYRLYRVPSPMYVIRYYSVQTTGMNHGFPACRAWYISPEYVYCAAKTKCMYFVLRI